MTSLTNSPFHSVFVGLHPAVPRTSYCVQRSLLAVLGINPELASDKACALPTIPFLQCSLFNLNGGGILDQT